MSTLINRNTFKLGVAELIKRDKDFARLYARIGAPPKLWRRAPGFVTLLRIILEQQVSLASAQATYLKLLKLTGEITPESFLALDDATLRGIGYSRQKTRYTRILAEAVLRGELKFEKLRRASDDEVRAALTALTGIGAWTAEIYLLLALQRADAFPVGDLGVIIGVQKLYELPHKPTREELLTRAESWRPWRGVATFMLWHYYLTEITRSTLELV